MNEISEKFYQIHRTIKTYEISHIKCDLKKNCLINLKHLFIFFPGSLMTVVQAGFSPGGNCDGENTAQVQT